MEKSQFKIYTFGCKLNQSESEAVEFAFRKNSGTSPHEQPFPFPVFVINSCTVTSKAEQKARRVIRQLQSEHPDSVIVVTGCYAQLDPAEIEKLGPSIIAVGMEGKSRLLRLPQWIATFDFQVSHFDFVSRIRQFFDSKEENLFYFKETGVGSSRFDFSTDSFTRHARAFLKIQDGCNNRCSYCRVPLARGNSVSLDHQEVLSRALRLQEAGYQEIVLTGVNISSYFDSEIHFPKLISSLSHTLKKNNPETPARIRLSSLEPDSITPELLGALNDPLICPHFHLPIQSYSSSVLKRMDRHYNQEEALRAVEALKKVKNDPFIAADIITGFDGETDNEFEETCAAVANSGFAHIHVFPFSPREGTRSETPIQPVPERVRDQRAAHLRQLSETGYAQYIQRQLNTDVLGLWEGKTRYQSKDYFCATSENYLKLFIPCASVQDRAFQIGTVRPMKITGYRQSILLAELIEPIVQS